ncbi:MAG TPA: hopanoid-associated sugar epimerase [Pseudolabrys sp.]|nr:hopanoid-associated sugar epimerase [Pseudolabrys sp.]
MADSGKVLVTGASGFVGSAVARALTQRGYAVRAIVRPSSAIRHLDGLDLEFVHGDLRDRAAVRHAMTGVRSLFHVAADYRLWARDPEEIVQNNVLGTRQVMQEARRAGVERIVYTSSVATLKCGPDGVPGDETAPIEAAQAIGAYKRSKVSAERLVEAMVAEGLPAVIVNPSTPIGPSDVKPTPTGRMILQAAARRMPAFVDTGLNMVHVDDVAEGHLAAFERGRIGERYILGGQNATLAEILATVAAECGHRPPRIKIPRAAAMPIAVVAEALAHRTGREPLVTRDGLRMSKNRMFFSTSKAERELGFRARPYAQAVHDAVEWFRHAGYLRR